MAKIFLYFILIGRLFNHYFAQIHQYPKYIKYLLYYMLICSIINLINGSTCVVLVLTGYARAAAIFYVCIAVGAITDILLSLFCMVLCFRAIFSHNAKTPVFYVSVAKRQGFVAALQALVTISAECGYMLWVFLVLNGAALNVLQDYIYISNIVAMLECMLLMICIYVGFARKSNTVCFSIIIEFRMWTSKSNVSAAFHCGVMFQRYSCVGICCVWMEWCCCGCCLDRQYAEHFDMGLLVPNSSNERTTQDTSTPFTAGNYTVQISSAPDLQYLKQRKEEVQSASAPQLYAI